MYRVFNAIWSFRYKPSQLSLLRMHRYIGMEGLGRRFHISDIRFFPFLLLFECLDSTNVLHLQTIECLLQGVAGGASRFQTKEEVQDTSPRWSGRIKGVWAVYVCK